MAASGQGLANDAKRAGWLRFVQVTEFVPDGHSLFRCSAPSYNKKQAGTDYDASQKLTRAAVQFLVDHHIDSIISFNKYGYKQEEIDRLANASRQIAYKHLPVDDWCAPTLEQLKQASAFFSDKSSTLLHCGYGHGRTGTGVTGLQICYSNGQTLQPFANTWWGSRGNHVEKRAQMSVLAELRNDLLQNKSNGFPGGGIRKEFAIINYATGFYLTLSGGSQSVTALSPEVVDHNLFARRQYRWFIKRDGTTNNFRLSNCANARTLVTTKSSGAAVGDPVTNGQGTGANTLFTTTEASGRAGVYMISPVNPASPQFAIAINEPDDSGRDLRDSREMPALLAAKNDMNKFGLWILFPVVDSAPRRQ